ncbi:MAG: recombination regulator RecX [Actinomycetota bacterium]|nr:recombination regulator RecX [Actinomycetota bacterium]
MTPVQEAVPGLATRGGLGRTSGSRSAFGRTSGSNEDLASEAGPTALLDGARREAMARAGRLLSSRPRTEKELRDRLGDAGFDPGVVAAVLDRLKSLGLVDDAAFAAQWVEERAGRKKLSARALLHELSVKGIPAEIAESALATAGVDEEAQAVELAAAAARRLATKPLAEQFTRLQQMLLRKGYPAEVAEVAARKVLPPDGWD